MAPSYSSLKTETRYKYVPGNGKKTNDEYKGEKNIVYLVIEQQNRCRYNVKIGIWDLGRMNRKPKMARELSHVNMFYFLQGYSMTLNCLTWTSNYRPWPPINELPWTINLWQILKAIN